MAEDSCLARKQLPHSYIALPCPLDGGPVVDQLPHSYIALPCPLDGGPGVDQLDAGVKDPLSRILTYQRFFAVKGGVGQLVAFYA